MLTSEQLAEWWRLADAATPGPLTHHGNHVYSEKDADLQRHAFFEDAADAALYVAARSAVPALLAEVERLQVAWSAEHDAYIRADEQARMAKREVESLRAMVEEVQR